MGTTTEKLSMLLASKNAIKSAISERTGEDAGDLMSAYAEKILAIQGGGESLVSAWTGHVDTEGLKAIGWTDEDIAYYQKNGVQWMEEDDYLYKVTDDNKALYGVLNATNVAEYKDRIVYLPKIDTSGVTSFADFFVGCVNLISVPYLETSQATSMASMFEDCVSLVCVPCFDTSNVKTLSAMFNGCYSLIAVPSFNTEKVTSMAYFVQNCNSLAYFPSLNTSNVTNMNYMFRYGYSLSHVSELDAINSSRSATFSNCRILKVCLLKNMTRSTSFANSNLLSKYSLLYMINNAETSSSFTITLHARTYELYAEDEEIVAALSNHPNVSLASA